MPYWHCPVERLHISGLVHELGVQWHPVPTPLMVPHAGVGLAQVWQVVPVPPQSASVSPPTQP